VKVYPLGYFFGGRPWLAISGADARLKAGRVTSNVSGKGDRISLGLPGGDTTDLARTSEARGLFISNAVACLGGNGDIVT